uniref:protein phosphatase methylesterase-1 n=2 Tax=Palpitomonas bilix TaxID=652834 RepID=A0A7S3FXP0_9EUKA|mmetsp:Transcript_11374/g.30075  ORF Transcript_11374/g.30075 Transcript_11374/m.30075 type:complete len:266 (+) Transcript_11374:816-1613(+)
MVLLHGGGYSGLSWAPLMEKMTGQECTFLAYDCRGHGETTTSNDYALSEEQQICDCEGVIEAFLQVKGRVDEQRPDIHLVGHSMGGAIAGKAGGKKRIKGLKGCIVIDVVEGTALSSLQFMHTVLSKRPADFSSLSEAIQWNVATGAVKSSEAARVSVPGMLKEEGGKWKWRIDLTQTERHWKGWFEGLSEAFLSCPGSRLLLLAGTDRLDKPLTIGQMQGKFQMVTLPACGHVLQEDNPAGVAKALHRYLERTRPIDLSHLKHA